MKNPKNIIDAPAVLSGGFLEVFTSYFETTGKDPKLLQFFADEFLSSDISNSIKVSELCQLLDYASSVANEPLIGINLAQADFYQPATVQMLLILSAPTVEVGLNKLVTYSKYLEPSIVPTLDIKPDVSSISFTVVDVSQPDKSKLNEFLLAGLLNCLKAVTAFELPVREIWLEHSPHEDLADYHRLLGKSVRFDRPVNRIVFDSYLLKERPLSRNPSLHRVLTEGLLVITNEESSSANVVDVVSREIARIYPVSAVSVENVAENMALTPRTLTRKLAEEGTSFNQLKVEFLKARAVFFLTRTNQNMYQIALELGYSDQSAFCRAFKKWFNKTPDQFRQENQR